MPVLLATGVIHWWIKQHMAYMFTAMVKLLLSRQFNKKSIHQFEDSAPPPPDVVPLLSSRPDLLLFLHMYRKYVKTSFSFTWSRTKWRATICAATVSRHFTTYFQGWRRGRKPNPSQGQSDPCDFHKFIQKYRESSPPPHIPLPPRHCWWYQFLDIIKITVGINL